MDIKRSTQDTARAIVSGCGDRVACGRFQERPHGQGEIRDGQFAGLVEGDEPATVVDELLQAGETRDLNATRVFRTLLRKGTRRSRVFPALAFSRPPTVQDAFGRLSGKKNDIQTGEQVRL